MRRVEGWRHLSGKMQRWPAWRIPITIGENGMSQLSVLNYGK